MKYFFLFLTLCILCTGCKKGPTDNSGVISKTESTQFSLDYAQKLLEEKKYEEAVSVLEKMARQDPYNRDIQTALANAAKNAGLFLFSENQTEKARKHLLNAIKITPDDTEAATCLSVIYYTDALKQEKNSEKYIKNLQESLFYNNFNTDSATLLSEYYMSRSEYEKAAVIWEKIMNHKETAAYAKKLSDIYTAAGNAEKSALYFEKAQTLSDTQETDLGISPEMVNLIEKKCIEDFEAKNYRAVIDRSEQIRKSIGEANPELLKILGISYFYENMPETALDFLTKALKAKPDDNMALSFLARCQVKLSNLSDAAETMNKLIERSPSDKEYLFDYANIHTELKHYSEARDAYEKLKILYPDDAEIYEKTGVLFFKTGRFDSAIAEWQRALELNPKNASYYFYIAAAWSKLNSMHQALEYYEKAVQNDPENPQYHYYLFAAYQKSRMYEKMEEQKNILLAIDPNGEYGKKIKQMFSIEKPSETKVQAEISFDSVKNNYDYALAYAKNGDFDNAEKYFLKVLENTPAHIDSLINLGNVYIATNHPEKAIYYYNRAIAAEPSVSAAYQFAGQAYINLELYSEAKTMLEKAVLLDKRNTEAKNLLESLSKNQNPDADEAFARIGAFYLNRQEPSQAMEYYSKAQNAGNAVMYKGIAACLIQQKKYREALETLAKCESECSQDADFYQLKGSVYSGFGDHLKAASEYTNALNIAFSDFLLLETSEALILAGKNEQAKKLLTANMDKIADESIRKNCAEKLKNLEN